MAMEALLRGGDPAFLLRGKRAGGDLQGAMAAMDLESELAAATPNFSDPMSLSLPPFSAPASSLAPIEVPRGIEARKVPVQKAFVHGLHPEIATVQLAIAPDIGRPELNGVYAGTADEVVPQDLPPDILGIQVGNYSKAYQEQ